MEEARATTCRENTFKDRAPWSNRSSAMFDEFIVEDEAAWAYVGGMAKWRGTR